MDPAPKAAVRKKKASPAAAGTGPAIAITGATGFLGSNLLSLLRTDEHFERIVVLDINKPPLPVRKTRYYKTDLTEPNCDARLAEIFRKENVRQVVHLAFLQGPQRNNGYAHELEVIGTLHLLHACAQQNVERLVTATTTMVYGALPDNPNFLTEDMPLRAGRDFEYIGNRVEAEELLARFAAKHTKTQVTVLRPAMTLGPRLRTYITRFFSRPLIPTAMGYDPLLQFVHEDDVLDVLRRVVEGEAGGGIFNLSGEGVLPLSTLLRVGGKWNLATPSFALYPGVGAAWFAGASLVPPPFLDYLRYLCVADPNLAREKLGFSPRHSTRDTWLEFTGEERLRRFR